MAGVVEGLAEAVASAEEEVAASEDLAAAADSAVVVVARVGDIQARATATFSRCARTMRFCEWR